MANTANKFDNIVQQNEAMSKAGATELGNIFTIYSEDQSYYGCASLKYNPKFNDLCVNEE